MSAAITALAAAVERRVTDVRALPRSAAEVADRITHGGVALNIVPATTLVLYHLRAPDDESLQQRETRVRAYSEAGALSAGCAHEVTQVPPVLELTGLAAITDDTQRERLIGPQRQRLLIGRVSGAAWPWRLPPEVLCDRTGIPSAALS